MSSKKRTVRNGEGSSITVARTQKTKRGREQRSRSPFSSSTSSASSASSASSRRVVEHVAFYEFLGVTPTASGEEIRKAYYGLAKKMHPDKNPADEEAAERFKELGRIYKALSDPKKRGEYDRYGDVERDGGEGDEEYDARMVYEAVMEYIKSLKRVQASDLEDFFARMARLRRQCAVDRDEDSMLRDYSARFGGDQKKILRHCSGHAAGYEAALDRKRFVKHLSLIAQEQAQSLGGSASRPGGTPDLLPP